MPSSFFPLSEEKTYGDMHWMHFLKAVHGVGYPWRLHGSTGRMYWQHEIGFLGPAGNGIGLGHHKHS